MRRILGNWAERAVEAAVEALDIQGGGVIVSQRTHQELDQVRFEDGTVQSRQRTARQITKARFEIGTPPEEKDKGPTIDL